MRDFITQNFKSGSWRNDGRGKNGYRNSEIIHLKGLNRKVVVHKKGSASSLSFKIMTGPDKINETGKMW